MATFAPLKASPQDAIPLIVLSIPTFDHETGLPVMIASAFYVCRNELAASTPAIVLVSDVHKLFVAMQATHLGHDISVPPGVEEEIWLHHVGKNYKPGLAAPFAIHVNAQHSITSWGAALAFVLPPDDDDFRGLLDSRRGPYRLLPLLDHEIRRTIHRLCGSSPVIDKRDILSTLFKPATQWRLVPYFG